jgi:hypothetical protein
MAALEASCQLIPAADNPYSAAPLPLQIAQAMEREGRLGAAALAYEAAARVCLFRLYSCRQVPSCMHSHFWRYWPVLSLQKIAAVHHDIAWQLGSVR